MEMSENLHEKPYLKSFGEKWQFEDDIEDYQQFESYANAWDSTQHDDYMDGDSIIPTMLFNGYFSTTWRLETAGGMKLMQNFFIFLSLVLQHSHADEK